ncbi:MAG TPA: hypothetical protein VKE22_20425 [Haliangiales bacterium]|nr:hypothetical protein [Haliangiales bacterium]
MNDFESLRAVWIPELVVRLREHVARLGWTPDQVRAHQRERLRALLARAVAHSPYHRRRLRGLDPHRFELADLASLPVMTKGEMMDDLGAVFTDRELTVDQVERALAATREEPIPIAGRYVAMASGGSSGRRGVFVFDREATLEFVSSIMRNLFARLGATPPGGLPIAMVAASSAVHATGLAPALTRDGLPFRFLPVPATLPLDEIVARLEALDPPLLFGYPTLLARLALARRAGQLRIAPGAITSTSETLTARLRATIAAGFGVPIVDTFGSTEGLVGTTRPDDPVLAFNSDACIAEVVDADNRPLPEGAPSAKVLVTNLANHLQPLIRYELTDRFTREPGDGYLRARVEGRADDVLQFGDVAVHPHAIRSVLVTTPEVIDYQICQIPRGVEILAIVAGALGDLRERIAAALVAAGLPDPEVRVRAVPTLARERDSAKLRRVVPLAHGPARID